MSKPILLLLTACFLATACSNSTDQPTSVPVETSGKMTSGLRHVVLFKFKPESTPQDIKRIEDAFVALPSKIKEIKEFEWSNNNISPENLGKGFTHYYVLTFANAEGRNIYLPHPAHSAFGAIVGPHLAEDGVLVFDYKF